MNKYLVLFITLFISTELLYSQNRIIKGRIISDQFDTLPLVSIMVNDTVEVGRTDFNGLFQIDIPINTEKILFIDIGLEPTDIKIKENCDEVEVVMLLSSTYDFMTPKKVDKLRLRRFQKIPELHKQAFEKGLFKTDKACYTQDFIPHYKKHTE